MTRTLIVLACLALSGAAPAWAWEYPSVSLQSALETGRMAFRGRIDSLVQSKREFTHTKARARVRVSECLYGPCSDARVVEIEYWVQSIAEPVDECFGFPTEFPLGGDVIFVFGKEVRTDRPMHFGTCHSEGSTLAYVWSDSPDGWPSEHSDDNHHSVWGGRQPPMTLAQLRALSDARRLALGERSR